MATEYRLVVNKGYVRVTYSKRDWAHAEIGVNHSFRDFQRYDDIPVDNSGWDAWIETRTVTDWQPLHQEGL